MIAGWSGSGKTTLVEKLLPELKKKKLKVGTVKHHHAALEPDTPGKDSYRHRKAGADKTIIAAPNSVTMMMSVDHEPVLNELIPLMNDMDIVVVEGYKMEKQPKIEVFRSLVHEKPRFLDDPDLIAIASDTELDSPVPVFDINNPEKLADFIAGYFCLSPAN
ncbi:MAG: molybdopterin-guanine dinucleotide biosynthesis protein B [Deltaproteobacteria bacterium]|nr:molybdopterin-guanine dinucleotide biosynthesis protein B [Deltaproteobacteria bacterium]